MGAHIKFWSADAVFLLWQTPGKLGNRVLNEREIFSEPSVLLKMSTDLSQVPKFTSGGG